MDRSTGFGIQITSDFSLAPSYLFLYVALAFAWAKGFVRIDFALLTLFAAVVSASLFSFVYGRPERSFPSLGLYWFVYFPFVFRPINPGRPDRNLCRLYYPLLLILAAAGVLQFFLQFVFHREWLFDYRPFIPPFFQNKNNMNTVISIGGLIKSNGFFLLEPSYFSQWMAYAILFFGVFGGSFAAGALFLLGLALSFSGTGIILLGVMMVFFISSISFGRRLFLIVSAAVFLLLGLTSQSHLTFSRLEEFRGGTGVRTTSAAARFLNPRITLQEGLSNSVLSFFLGNGPGTINKVIKDYEGHDPVWAKLFFEYGLIGGFLLLFFLLRSIHASQGSFLFFIPFFVQWLLLGGHLLTFDVVVLFVLYYKLAVYY